MQGLLKALAPVILTMVPVLLVLAAVIGCENTLLFSFAVAAVSIMLFFLRYELKKPRIRDILPIVVLAAAAAVGRIIFAPFPSFKPVTAIVMLGGLVFGGESGFLIGALSALASNMFFGQGAWTPWQMYSWGLIGYLSGLLANTRLFSKNACIIISGFAFSFLYGLIMDTWTLTGFVRPINTATATAVYLAGLPMNISHGAATVIFLSVLLIPWRKRLGALKAQYGILEDERKVITIAKDFTRITWEE